MASPPAANETGDAANGNSTTNAETAPEPKKTVMDRLGSISSTALHDFVDITVFLILGAMLAALIKQQIGSERIDTLSQQQPILAIPG